MPSRPKSTSAGNHDLVVTRRELRSATELLASAGPNSDLSYRVFDALDINGSSFHRSLFTGALFRGCRFANVEFSRSDLDGFKAESCTYENCRFIGCDIRSSSFEGCAFNDCNFDEALIKDCTFERCEFVDTSWRQTVTSDNSFASSLFVRCPLERSSFTQNRISLSRFVEMTLGDCTFLYIIFADCQFDRCAINAESVGMIFGLTAEDLMNLTILHSGEQLPTPESSKMVSAFLFEYARRGWSLGVCIMRLNFHITAELFAIHQYLKAVETDVENGLLLKREELDFLASVMAELYSRDRLPLLAIVDALNISWRVSRRIGGALHTSHTERALRSFISATTLLLQNAIERIEMLGITEIDLRDSRPVQMTVVFNRKPSIKMDRLFEALQYDRGLGAGRNRLLDVRRGSYVEVWEVTLGTVLMFNLMLISVNASLARLTELRARLLVLRRRKPPKEFMDMAAKPPPDSAMLIQPMLKQLMAVAESKTLLNSEGLKGLAFDNIKTIDVTPAQENTPSKARRRTRSAATVSRSGQKLLTAGPKGGKKTKKRSSE